MGTDYYRLRKPFTRIEIDDMGTRGEWRYVNVFIESELACHIKARGEVANDLIKTFFDMRNPVVHTYYGGIQRGIVVAVLGRLDSLTEDTLLLSGSGYVKPFSNLKRSLGHFSTEYNTSM
jgi:hypothetical protein